MEPDRAGTAASEEHLSLEERVDRIARRFQFEPIYDVARTRAEVEAAVREELQRAWDRGELELPPDQIAVAVVVQPGDRAAPIELHISGAARPRSPGVEPAED